ncbi:aldo/keto reductase [Clostridia bacterium]|nr:aldo/keto reductase [Clostridia bacterium]
MNYRKDKNGQDLSILGFGCMRFPRDSKETETMILKAVAEGVNYFDTAYIYPDSERVLGNILHKNGLREKIFIATKLPHQKCHQYEDFDLIFNEQKARLKTNYIDYYLIHNIGSIETWNDLKRMNIEKWLSLKKQSGEIRNIGFSFHGIQHEFPALLNAYNWEFCQIQYNYMNENYQAGTKGLKEANAKGLSIVIMEPLLGGKLANLPKKGADVLNSADIKPVEAALKWLWDKPEVTVVLSGMNSKEQVSENIKIASETSLLTIAQKKAILEVKKIFQSSYKIPCTGCNYCMPCPNRVNIPGGFASYNAYYANGLITGMQQYITSTSANDPENNSRISRCTGCKLCEQKCPQHIKIVKEIKNVKKRLEPFWFNTLMKIIAKVMSGKKN